MSSSLGPKPNGLVTIIPEGSVIWYKMPPMLGTVGPSTTWGAGCWLGFLNPDHLAFVGRVGFVSDDNIAVIEAVPQCLRSLFVVGLNLLHCSPVESTASSFRLDCNQVDRTAYLAILACRLRDDVNG